MTKYTPFRRPSCQAREEKRKFSPTANSLRRRRQRSRTWATAQRALPKRENGGRRYIKHDGTIASPVGSEFLRTFTVQVWYTKQIIWCHKKLPYSNCSYNVWQHAYFWKASELSYQTNPSLAQSDDEILPYYAQWHSKRISCLGLICDWAASKGLT